MPKSSWRVNILFPNLATISLVSKLHGTHHVQLSKQRQLEWTANDSLCCSFLRQCLNFCVISQMYCYRKLEKCHPNDEMFRQAWEIFDHQCQQYLTMSKICKTNVKPRGKSECFYYTQWHFGLTFFMPAQCAKGWFRRCFILLNRFHNTLYTSQWHDCALSRITDL